MYLLHREKILQPNTKFVNFFVTENFIEIFYFSDSTLRANKSAWICT